MARPGQLARFSPALAHVPAEAEGAGLAGDGPGRLALVDLVQQLTHEAAKARLVERLLEDLADQVGGFGLVHGGVGTHMINRLLISKQFEYPYQHVWIIQSTDVRNRYRSNLRLLP
jgi:hypothetical protein